MSQSGPPQFDFVMFTKNCGAFLRPVATTVIKHNKLVTAGVLGLTALDLAIQRMKGNVNNAETASSTGAILCGVGALRYAPKPFIAFGFSQYALVLTIARFAATSSKTQSLPSNSQLGLLGVSSLARFNSFAHAIGIPTGAIFASIRLTQNQTVNDGVKIVKDCGGELLASQPATEQTILPIVQDHCNNLSSGKEARITVVDGDDDGESKS